jgi:hypothetical protein
MDQTEFLQELRQMVVRRASSEHLVDSLALVTEVAERLQEDPVFGEFRLAEYASQDARKRQLRIHGFTEVDESDRAISLVIGRWVEESSPTSLTTADIDQLRGCLENFASEALSGRLQDRVTPSSEAYVLADLLHNQKKELSCIRLHIISNQALTHRFKKEFRSSIAGIPAETHIWDLQRLMALYGSDREREVVEIDLAEFGSPGVPCIEASAADGLHSYLCVIEGDVLANLFERYGSRLLEGNVRSFLGMKGNVNKGIRRTIQDASHLFFAYNNGIAATAASADVQQAKGSARITRISDLQIVNGGQTTASILRARKQDKLSLDGVTVPMKLTVVGREQAHDLIPRIAEYANTQNKVAIADFFANHPFHRKIEEISRRLLVPAKSGVRIQSKWFYERSRGQYQNERLYLTKAQKDQFDLQYPSKQVINKTELAKYDSIIDEKPHWVALGVQKNFLKFAGKFSPKGEKTETEYWDEISPNYSDAYYQRIAAMSLIWKAGEDIVSVGKGEWYRGDYRSQIVAYSCALMFHATRKRGREVDLPGIWQRQGTDENLRDTFRCAAILVQDALLDLPQGSTNVGEWAKKEACWHRVSSLPLDLGSGFRSWSIEKSEDRQRAREGRQQGSQDVGISLQQQVYDLAARGYWKSLCEWQALNNHVFGPDKALLEKAATVQGVSRIALERDWRKLLELKARCEDEGFRA